MIYKAKVAAGSVIYDIDAIEHEGGVWLVPLWREKEDVAYMQPEQMFRADLLPQFQRLPRGSATGDFLLGLPLPSEVLEGEPTEEQIEKYSILIRPPLLVRKTDA